MKGSSPLNCLDTGALTPRINRRQINQALKDDEALNTSFIGQERAVKPFPLV